MQRYRLAGPACVAVRSRRTIGARVRRRSVSLPTRTNEKPRGQHQEAPAADTVTAAATISTAAAAAAAAAAAGAPSSRRRPPPPSPPPPPPPTPTPPTPSLAVNHATLCSCWWRQRSGGEVCTVNQGLHHVHPRLRSTRVRQRTCNAQPDSRQYTADSTHAHTHTDTTHGHC